MKTSILVLYTGGTIGMMRDVKTGSLVPFNFDNLYDHLPVLRNLDYNIDFYSFENLIDSSNMTPEFWISLAGKIKENYDKYDGFVVLHGSDTMAYSASALSFMLENLAKPVVFTGSQLPMGMVRSDGRENIIASIEIAAAKNQEGGPMVPEVSILFENQLLRGNRSTKHNAEHFNAFVSGNYPNLADVGVRIKYNTEYIAQKTTKKLIVHTKMNSNVGILKLFPGITFNMVHNTLRTPEMKGLILETYGSGNAPTTEWFINELKAAIDNGLIIYNVTQCKSGSVEMGRYETSLNLNKIGVVSGHDITTESALAKLMYLIGEGYSREEVCSWLQVPLRGEMTI